MSKYAEKGHNHEGCSEVIVGAPVYYGYWMGAVVMFIMLWGKIAWWKAVIVGLLWPVTLVITLAPQVIGALQ